LIFWLLFDQAKSSIRRQQIKTIAPLGWAGKIFKKIK
jgi:hypothetical protein